MKVFRSPLIPLLIATLSLSGCYGLTTEPAEDPWIITIINQSAVPIQQIQYTWYGISGGVANADGSPLGHNDAVEISVSAPDGQILLSARDALDKTLGAAKISLAFNEENKMIVFLRDSSRGVDFYLSP